MEYMYHLLLCIHSLYVSKLSICDISFFKDCDCSRVLNVVRKRNMLTSKKCGLGGGAKRDCEPQIWLQNFLSASTKKSEENLSAASQEPTRQGDK